jgi:hypothetical protein
MPFGRARVLKQYDVQYYQCAECGFTQTQQPYWLAEAYTSALVAGDVGAVQRNLELADITQTVINRFFEANGRFLDYGGGHGVFVRLMRDRGFDFWWHDKYAENLYSVGFEETERGRPFELVTAFEVFEHLEDPVAGLSDMLARSCDAVLCSTQLLPPNNPKPGDWWYYGLGGGQHIALYTRAALERLASRFGYSVVSSGAWIHLLSRRRISESMFRLVIRKRVRSIFNWMQKRPSLIGQDYTTLTGEDSPWP